MFRNLVYNVFSRTLASVRLLVSAAIPNVFVLLPIIAIIVGLTKRDWILGRDVYESPFRSTWSFFNRPFQYDVFGIEINPDKWIAETAMLLGFLVLLNLLVLGLLARRSHARRWGRKPVEIERATRFFMG